MNIRFTARHFKASDELQSTLDARIGELSRFYERISGCHVVLDAERKSRLVAEISMSIRGKVLVAKAHADSMPKAIDSALSKIEKQLKKQNEKIKSHRKKKVETKVQEDEY